MQTADEIIRRMRLASKAETDADLAALLGTNKSTVSSWRGRNSVPLDASAKFAIDFNVSLDWLLLGRGPQHADDVREAGVGYASAAQRAPPDARRDAVIAWWVRWWDAASEEERVWALVQLRRAFPEFGEWARRG